MATIDEMEADHADYKDWISDTYGNRDWEQDNYGHTVTPQPKLQKIKRQGVVMDNKANVPVATKVQLLALREGTCPTCGKSSGCYVYDNLMLFYCHENTTHRFKELLNWGG